MAVVFEVRLFFADEYEAIVCVEYACAFCCQSFCLHRLQKQKRARMSAIGDKAGEYQKFLVNLQKLERETRFELATSTLARLHSTTELLPRAEKVCLQRSRSAVNQLLPTFQKNFFRLATLRIVRYAADKD